MASERERARKVGIALAAAGMLSTVCAGQAGQAPTRDAPLAETPASGPVVPDRAESVSAQPEALPEDDPTDTQPPTTIDQELDDIRPGVALKRKFDELAAKTNLRIGLAYTALFQQATGGQGYRRGAGGDFDFLAKWTAIGAGTKDTGVLAFAAEQRQEFGRQTPSELGGQIGSLTPTTNTFNERVLTVKELYWDQRLFEDRFRFIVGRLDPENLFGGHRLQNVNTFFLNKAFSSNPTVSFPGSGMVAAAQVTPAPWFYARGGVNDANGETTSANFEGFFEDGELLSFVETGLTPTIENVGVGRYRVSLWQRDAKEEVFTRPRDRGVSFSFDQDIGETWTVFLRFGFSDADVTRITSSVQGGFGLKGVCGKDNLFGFAGAWSDPDAAGLRDEKLLEVFQRFQVTETAQFTIGAQLILDPSNAPGDDAVGVFSARVRFSF